MFFPPGGTVFVHVSRDGVEVAEMFCLPSLLVTHFTAHGQGLSVLVSPHLGAHDHIFQSLDVLMVFSMRRGVHSNERAILV